MPRSVYVPLPAPARTALYELAEREFRNPRDQAALLLTEGLRRAGVLECEDRAPADGSGGGTVGAASVDAAR